METKDIKVWIVLEGYEIDKDKSNDSQIKNQRSRSWEEYCQKMEGKDSYFYDDYHRLRPDTFGSEPVLSEFADKEDVEALVAFCKLRKLRRDWIGMWKPDWTRDDKKFTIVVESNKIVDGLNTNVSCSMSFPTYEMRDEFVDTFRDLLEIAKPLL